MDIKKTWLVNRKRVWDILLVGLPLFIIVSPNAKTWIMKQIVSTGLLKAEIKKANSNDSTVKAFFSFKDSTGKIASTNDLKGKIVFINFWASWCPPCRAEMPSLENLYHTLKSDQRFVFVFINEDDDQSKAKRFLEENNYSLPVFTSFGNVPTNIFEGSLPTTVVLNKEGEIVLKHVGMASYDTESFMEQLKALL
ncbi:MAG: TlpA family protein disulfide reductase [Bacteroidetes bacterium]|nr:TlpA family protein disulfide reductase [Bacteroidota bacterium]